MNIEEKARQLISDQLGVSIDKVTPTANFIEDLGADSLDTVELVMAFEEEFEMEIDDVDAEQLTSLKKVMEFIESKNA